MPSCVNLNQPILLFILSPAKSYFKLGSKIVSDLFIFLSVNFMRHSNHNKDMSDLNFIMSQI